VATYATVITENYNNMRGNAFVLKSLQKALISCTSDFLCCSRQLIKSSLEISQSLAKNVLYSMTQKTDT
jgi:hypothetical protein